MKWILGCFVVLLGMCPSVCGAATVTKFINFEWEYDVTLKGLAGYILYQNGILLHTVNDPKALSVDLSVGLTPGAVEVFTMKAFDKDKKESALSAPYSLVVPSTVEGSNFLPSAMISTTQGAAHNVVLLTAAGSIDFDGSISNYEWDFGDGKKESFLSDQSISHTYGADGDYVVTLRVVDNSGGAGEIKKDVSINTTTLPTMPGFRIMLL
jgi:PKD repeat protein